MSILSDNRSSGCRVRHESCGDAEALPDHGESLYSVDLPWNFG